MRGRVAPTPAFELSEHRDLIALPERFCLYDRAGVRVEASRHWTFNRFIGPDPETADVDVPLETVDRTVVYGGLVPKPHFGHFLTEAFTRLWPYDDEDLGTLPHVHHLHRSRRLLPFESTLMDAATAGVAGPFVGVDRPMLLRRVLIPTQSIVLEQPIPPRAVRVYDRIRRGLAPSIVPSARPIYLSRSRIGDGRRRTLGEVALEERLARAGFAIVHPQELPLPEQIRMAASSRTVVGLFGSALHLTLFRALDEARTIALNPASPSRLQIEIDRVRGAENLGIRAEYPLHPRHPAIRGGKALQIGPYRNMLLPGRISRAILDVAPLPQ